jgi:hypothetical protein
MPKNRLQIWADSLSKEKAKEILVELTEKLIESEDIRFSEDNKSPYWEACGDNIDGTEN